MPLLGVCKAQNGEGVYQLFSIYRETVIILVLNRQILMVYTYSERRGFS